MGRQIVVCCDGTWNVPDETREGVAAPTNVAKPALCVAVGTDSDQELFYEPGVGTTRDDRVLGGGFGYGLSQNIRNAYRFLAEHYEPGDDLFLFGFSRSAYTARSLAGLIRNCGLLRHEYSDEVDAAFSFYRDRTSTTHPSSLASELFRRTYAYESSDIHFIGVWDTVGALMKRLLGRRPAVVDVTRSSPGQASGQCTHDVVDEGVGVWPLRGSDLRVP